MKLLRKMKGHRGFTFVEMIVVIAILAIITAVAVPSVASYTTSIKLMELDDSARAIYMAVQNRFTTMKEAGKDLTFGYENDYVKPPKAYIDALTEAEKEANPDAVISYDNYKNFYVITEKSTARKCAELSRECVMR